MTTATASLHPAPNWNLVHFDVGCARCGTDLRGLTEPKCPACALEFDWSVAVPLEALTCQHCGYHLYGLCQNRCPECGESFAWDDVLTAYHRTRIPFFEYQYRRHPFRVFARAFVDSIHPRRLWSTISLHDPPRVGALLILWIACAAVMVGLPAALGEVYQRLIAVMENPWTSSASFFGSWRGQPFGVGEAVFAVLALAAWCGVMFLTLASMHWSLKACRVRRAHVLRVCMYVPPFVMIMPAGLYTIMFIADVLVVHRFVDQRIALFLVQAFLSLGNLAVFVCSIIHVGIAYKRYIKMRHAWGIAIAASLAALLAAITVSSWRGLVRFI